MGEVIEITKTKQQHNTTQEFSNRKKASVFQLVKSIPLSQDVKLNEEASTQDHFTYARYLIQHLNTVAPKKLKAMSFDTEKDTIFSLCNTLADVLLDDGQSIEFFDYKSTTMLILTPMDYNSTIYNFSVGYLDKTRSLPLKVGIAHIISNYLANNLGYFEDFADIENLSVNDVISDEIGELAELKDFFHEEKQQLQSFIARVKSSLRTYNKYKSLPISIFYEHTPNSKLNRKLKKHISKVLKYDLSILLRIGENRNCEEDHFSFIETFILTIDEKQKFDQYYINEKCRYFGEGGTSQPANYISYSEQGVEVSDNQNEIHYFKLKKHLGKLINILSNI